MLPSILHRTRAIAIVTLALFLCTARISFSADRDTSPDLQRLRQLAPSKAFDEWLAASGEKMPDLDALPARGLAEDPLIKDPVAAERAGGVGEKVTREQWPAQRKHLLGLMEKWLVGRAPEAGEVRGIVEEKGTDEKGRAWQRIRLEFGPGFKAILHCWYYPPKVAGKRPIYMSDNTRYLEFGADAYEKGGFGLLRYNATDPVYSDDKKDESAAFAELWGREYDWSAFRRRGWSASRAVDWLITQDEVDPKKIYIGGNSRSAKQAMVGAAYDERIAGVIASSPGSGGSLAYRYCDGSYFGEGVELLTGNFPDWVSHRARFFTGRENRLPIDMHVIYSLIAPRPVLMSSALKDGVENTWAIEQSYQLNKGVYELLGAAGNLAVRYRPGVHKPDDPSYVDSSRCLVAMAEGKPIEDLFPYRPMHPWNYSAWAKAHGDVKPIDKAAAVKERIEWLLGNGPAQRELPVEFAKPAGGKIAVTFGDAIAGDLYMPKEAEATNGRGKLPAVVWLAPLHTSLGYVASYKSGEQMHTALSKAGIAVLAFDPIGTGTRRDLRLEFYEKNPDWSLMGKMVSDARSAVDALAKRPEVDSKRIFIVGYAMGGMTATIAGALDGRVAGVVSIAGWTPMRTDTDAKGTGGARRWSNLYGWMPRVGAFVGGREGEIPVDFGEMVAATRGRGARVLVIQPRGDWNADWHEVEKAVAEAGGQALLPDDWNRLTNAREAEVVEWIKK